MSRFFYKAKDDIRDGHVTGVQTCALPIWQYSSTAAPELGSEVVPSSHGARPHTTRLRMKLARTYGSILPGMSRRIVCSRGETDSSSLDRVEPVSDSSLSWRGSCLSRAH